MPCSLQLIEITNENRSRRDGTCLTGKVKQLFYADF